MTDQTTLSYINMFGVLGALEDLCRLDDTAQNAVQGKTIAVRFTVKNGPQGRLGFDQGICHMAPSGAKGDIHLRLGSPETFNALMEGKANPIPTKGFLKLGFMTGPFDQLTQRLEAVMRPSEKDLADPAFRAVHTELLMHVAGGAICQVAAHDPELKQWAKAMPQGVIGFEIKDGPALHLVADQGALRLQRGRAEAPRALMQFTDVDSAFAMLSGQTDSFSAIANEKLTLAGFVPMLDVLDKFLIRVGRYLA